MEDANIEYKLDIPKNEKDFKAEIVSFLNTKGGEIFLGVNDDGKLNQEIADSKKKKWEETLSNWIFNAFSPDVTNLISIYPNENPFRIKILEGKKKPYFYKNGEGFNGRGVYIRIESTKRLATSNQVERMIKSRDASDFETISIGRTDLTFEYLKKRYKEKGINFNKKLCP
ncbi:Divergent AAA domain [Mycoplasmopsis citelli]|uniref:Divergent AAA domain n=1 Tax=Mycoplasmopsis citelli TaxID=171281 RepID=A0A449B1N5_9BACT|nr:ATP-binding protein [Mycoplasmopsis citelli]VEU74486.1 Divergent AAA domain [Mycoplasmopsis citelli]